MQIVAQNASPYGTPTNERPQTKRKQSGWRPPVAPSPYERASQPAGVWARTEWTTRAEPAVRTDGLGLGGYGAATCAEEEGQTCISPH
jgi:hypothetical protein